MSLYARVALRVLLALSMFVVAAQASEEIRTFDLAIRAGELPPDMRVIRVQQGDHVTLRWTTDRSVTIHLHGYDIEKKVPVGGEPTVMRFTARATGRFPIELHGADHGHEKILAYLEVHPR